MDAEMIKSKLEIRNVGFDLHIEELASNQVGKKEDLFWKWEHERTQGSDVCLQWIASNGHELLGEGHAHPTFIVLLLVHTSVALVICSFVRPHNVIELVLGSSLVRAFVREQDGSSTNSEQTVGYEHGSAIPEIPILGDVFCAYHNSIGAAVHLKNVPGKVNGNYTCAATHSSQIVGPNITSHLVLVHNHGRKRGSGIEERAIHNQHSNLLGLHLRFLEKLVQATKHDGFWFLSGCLHGGTWRKLVHSGRKIGILTKTRSLHDSLLELDALLLEEPRGLGALDEDIESDFQAFVLRQVARVIHQVDRSGPWHEVDGGRENHERRADEHNDEIELQILPELPDIVRP